MIEAEHITWMDAEGSDGWHRTGQEKYEVCILNSVGFVVHEDDVLLVIAETVSKDGMHTNRSKIPKVCILERHKIKLKKIKDS